MATAATLMTRGIFRDAQWSGTYLKGEPINIGLHLHYEVTYTKGPVGGGVFTFPATQLLLVELGVPVRDIEGAITGYVPPSNEYEIQAFVPTLTWAQWTADGAALVLRNGVNWNIRSLAG